MLCTADTGRPVQAATNGPRASSSPSPRGASGRRGRADRAAWPPAGRRRSRRGAPGRSVASVRGARPWRHRRAGPPRSTDGRLRRCARTPRPASTTPRRRWAAPAGAPPRRRPRRPGRASTATGTTSSMNVTRSRTRPVGSRVSAAAPRGPVHIRTRVPPVPLASAVAATTTRWPARSSAQSRWARGEAPATRAATRSSAARRPRAGQLLVAPRRGRRGAVAAGRPRMPCPSRPRRRTRRRRRRPPASRRCRARPSGAAPAGGARRPAPRHPAGRRGRRAAGRGRPRGHGRGPTRRAPTRRPPEPRCARRGGDGARARSASRTERAASRAGRRPEPGPGPTRWRRRARHAPTVRRAARPAAAR